MEITPTVVIRFQRPRRVPKWIPDSVMLARALTDQAGVPAVRVELPNGEPCLLIPCKEL